MTVVEYVYSSGLREVLESEDMQAPPQEPPAPVPVIDVVDLEGKVYPSRPADRPSN